VSTDPWGIVPDDVLVILIDTREQRPLRFSPAVHAERATLPTGDYSLVGYTDRITIERKAPEDLWQCCGRERDRFEAELVRMRNFDHRAVVIEATIDAILMTPPAGRIKPETVIRSTIGWQMDYGIPFVWCGSPRIAAAWVERALTRLPRKAMEAERKASRAA
jgi:DNA excision repair protein ERCC-4